MVETISKTYGGNLILDTISFSLSASSRVVLLGANGAGKSTLFRLLTGLEQPDTGEVHIAPSVVIGYLDQEQGTLPHKLKVFDAYRAGYEGHWEERKAEMLRYGLFVYDDLHKQVDTLSVGQQRKLQIARLMIRQANLLLLDEPTNHISLDVLEEFEEALLAFQGPILAISHDRRFIQKFADEIWELKEGRLIQYAGGWDVFC